LLNGLHELGVSTNQNPNYLSIQVYAQTSAHKCTLKIQVFNPNRVFILLFLLKTTNKKQTKLNL